MTTMIGLVPSEPTTAKAGAPAGSGPGDSGPNAAGSFQDALHQAHGAGGRGRTDSPRPSNPRRDDSRTRTTSDDGRPSSHRARPATASKPAGTDATTSPAPAPDQTGQLTLAGGLPPAAATSPAAGTSSSVSTVSTVSTDSTGGVSSATGPGSTAPAPAAGLTDPILVATAADADGGPAVDSALPPPRRLLPPRPLPPRPSCPPPPPASCPPRLPTHRTAAPDGPARAVARSTGGRRFATPPARSAQPSRHASGAAAATDAGPDYSSVAVRRLDRDSRRGGTPTVAPQRPSARATDAPLQPDLSAAFATLRTAPSGSVAMTVALHPADLGAVQIHATFHEGDLNVTVACADEASRHAVAAALAGIARAAGSIRRRSTCTSATARSPRPETVDAPPTTRRWSITATAIRAGARATTPRPTAIGSTTASSSSGDGALDRWM